MNRAPLMMNAGHFAMAPLSDFVVTETKYRVKDDPLPQMGWVEWRNMQPDYQDYDLTPVKANGRQTIVMVANRPTDVEVVLGDDLAVLYDLYWADDAVPA